MDKRALILGASGLVGSALVGELEGRNGIDVIGTCYSKSQNGYVHFDMENGNSAKTLISKIHPSDIYIAAYMSNVDACEIDGNSRQINVEGVRSIVSAAKEINARIIFFSSSYVFDGTKQSAYTIWDLPFPVQQYGIHKLLCEILVINANRRNVVVRTVGVFGKESKRKNFAYQVIDNISKSKELYVSTKQRINPIHAEKLASFTVNLVEDGWTGLAHVAGSEEVTKYDFAVDVARKFDLNSDKIIPIHSDSIPGKALRPVNGCLGGGISFDYIEALGLFYAKN